MSSTKKKFVIKWEEVLKTHRSWRGVAVRGGKVVSLLCNQHKDGGYGDSVYEDRIGYVMPNNALGAERRALVAMLGTNAAFHVFEKLGVNAWKEQGEWVVANVMPGEQTTVFELRPAFQGKCASESR